MGNVREQVREKGGASDVTWQVLQNKENAANKMRKNEESEKNAVFEGMTDELPELPEGLRLLIERHSKTNIEVGLVTMALQETGA